MHKNLHTRTFFMLFFLSTTPVLCMDIIEDKIEPSDRRIEIVDKTGDNQNKYFCFLNTNNLHRKMLGPIIRSTKTKNNVHVRRWIYSTQYEKDQLLMFSSIKDMKWRKSFHIVNTDNMKLQQDIERYILIKEGYKYKLVHESNEDIKKAHTKPSLLDKLFTFFHITNSTD